MGKRTAFDLCRRPFCRRPTAELPLAPRSPCIDAGTTDGIGCDFGGTPVPQGKAADIGAYEFVAK